MFVFQIEKIKPQKAKPPSYYDETTAKDTTKINDLRNIVPTKNNQEEKKKQEKVEISEETLNMLKEKYSKKGEFGPKITSMEKNYSAAIFGTKTLNGVGIREGLALMHIWSDYHNQSFESLNGDQLLVIAGMLEKEYQRYANHGTFHGGKINKLKSQTDPEWEKKIQP